MTGWLSRLSINQRLALVAFVLGLVAVFARPMQGGSVTVSPDELAVIVQKEVDHVRPLELADWIIAGSSDYRLVDLRDDKAFAAYHIPTAENIPLATLPASDIGRNEKIVLYSDGGIHSAQAWFLMKAKGYRAVYMLFGGLDGWKDEVLFPAIAENAPLDRQADTAKRRAISAYFGGTPGAAAGTLPASSAAMPKVTMPAGAKPAAAKKKREGC